MGGAQSRDAEAVERWILLNEDVLRVMWRVVG